MTSGSRRECDQEQWNDGKSKMKTGFQNDKVNKAEHNAGNNRHTNGCKSGLFWTVLIVLAIAMPVLSLGCGSVFVSPSEVVRALMGKALDATNNAIVLYVRMPRTLGAVFAGAALAVSGAIIQSVLSNPLAAPNIIGVNSGAGFMVVLMSAVMPMSYSMIPLAAFAGAFLGVMAVLFIAEKAGASRITLVLAGVAMSSIFSAGLDTIITFVPNAVGGYMDFKIGGLDNLSMDRIRPAFIVIFVCILLAVVFADELDILMLGGETAKSLGLPVKRVRIMMLAAAAALAGAAVSFCGLLGFVGLIVPHMMRRFTGEESRKLIISSALAGASLLTFCDVLSRIIFAPYEIPVGIVMSFIGGPFFIWLLLHQRGGRIHD